MALAAGLIVQSEAAPSQADRARAFQALHVEGIFVMPCAWDMGSARLFEAAGFASVGTTSGGVNWSNGRRDYVYGVPKAEMLAAYSAIVTATSLPVSGDLEHGYGETEADVADTIAQAIDGGMVGGSIEDRHSSGELFEPSTAAARIAAARRAADADLAGFVITARAESLYAQGVSDPMTDAIERCKRYVDAGADCIFVPGVAAPTRSNGWSPPPQLLSAWESARVAVRPRSHSWVSWAFAESAPAGHSPAFSMASLTVRSTRSTPARLLSWKQPSPTPSSRTDLIRGQLAEHG